MTQKETIDRLDAAVTRVTTERDKFKDELRRTKEELAKYQLLAEGIGWFMKQIEKQSRKAGHFWDDVPDDDLPDQETT